MKQLKKVKQLRDILYTVQLREVNGMTDIPIKHICFDSRKVQLDTLFIALPGTQVDGHKFIDNAIQRGATAILCEHFPEELQLGITYLGVENAAHEMGKIAANFYDHPSKKLRLVGVTGTNGKTTIATLLYRLFRSLQYNVGLLSTIRYLINDEETIATHTTPDVLTLNALLAKMVDQACEYCFMEVSSHAVVQERISGLHFTGGLFTNITHDHLDYHGTFDAYIRAKKGFFDRLPTKAFALTNADDKRGEVMLQNTKAQKQKYALKAMADFRAKVLENNFEGLVMQLDGAEVHSFLVGEFNAYNLLAVYSTAILLGEEKMEVLTAISQLAAADGRFDCVKIIGSQTTGIVDYAHTPDALVNVLKTINAIRTRNEQLITIVGCGGDRDRTKRPVMAKVACEYSDKVILTSDNPRSEEPEAIIEEMKKGVEPHVAPKVLAITNRLEAIKTACMLANDGDIILLAGKGHEQYQEIKGVKYPFDDKTELRNALEVNRNK